ncbi:AAA family ATPase [Asanoa siamensis]|uniref:AAA family ATPase n=1 Tax=Asanoa siamensis TaxID=926357 RepID=UPI00194221AE|nr:AAA family ATPase [Asanoa siamensis]
MRTTRGGASPVMIGRDRELRQLRKLVAARRPGVAMICGEPGVGKTRLVRELLSTLDADTVVLVGQAEPGSLSRPYEVLMDALDGRAGVDGVLLAELGDSARSPVERLHSGVRLVGDLIAGRPAVIVFEDLHWADSESAALFERIADLDGPYVVLGSYRPAEVTGRDPVSALLARLGRRHAVTRLDLAPFDEADTATLLAAVTGRPPRHRAPWPRCTSARAATRSSSRSCSAATSTTTSTRSTSARCRGASPRCSGARSTTWSPTSAASSRRRPCSATGSTSTCWRRSPAPTRTS